MQGSGEEDIMNYQKFDLVKIRWNSIHEHSRLKVGIIISCFDKKTEGVNYLNLVRIIVRKNNRMLIDTLKFPGEIIRKIENEELKRHFKLALTFSESEFYREVARDEALIQ